MGILLGIERERERIFDLRDEFRGMKKNVGDKLIERVIEHPSILASDQLDGKAQRIYREKIKMPDDARSLHFFTSHRERERVRVQTNKYIYIDMALQRLAVK